MNKYKTFDDSREAKEWRANNKERVRKLQKNYKKPASKKWLLYVCCGILMMISFPIGIIACCITLYVTRNS